MKQKNCWVYILLFLSCIVFCSSHKNDDRLVAYPHATNNRHELEKVIEHFKNSTDTLKYKAALFLIQNMPYNYSIYGDNMPEYETAYHAIARKSKESRSQEYLQLSKNIDKSTWKAISDIQTINANFLISHINETVDNWRSQTWAKEYSQNDFFNYVLPYRIANETLSDWHHTIDAENFIKLSTRIQAYAGSHNLTRTQEKKCLYKASIMGRIANIGKYSLHKRRQHNLPYSIRVMQSLLH